MPEETLTYIILENAYYIALDIREVMKRLRPGYRLAAIAETAGEAIAMILRDSPDLLIADTTAGDGDTMKILKESGVDIPVVFISEYRHLAKRADAFTTADFILKPATPAELQEALFRIEKKMNQQPINTML